MQFSKMNASDQRGGKNLALKNVNGSSFPRQAQQAKAEFQDSAAV